MKMESTRVSETTPGLPFPPQVVDSERASVEGNARVFREIHFMGPRTALRDSSPMQPVAVTPVYSLGPTSQGRQSIPA